MAEMTGSWRRGETILTRYVRHGEVFYAFPAIVVEDTPGRLITFMPMGTPVQRSRIDFKTGDIERPKPGAWHSTNVVRFYEPDIGFIVAAAYAGATGEFLCWYIDLADPIRRAGGGIVTWDQSLDIVAAPDLSWQMKDEDHFALIQQWGWITPERAAAIRRDAQTAIARIEARAAPFNEPWPHWRPDPAWQLPVLPDDWAVPPP